MMLSADTIRAIERALDEGKLPQTAIAAEYGISRRTVQKIAGGEIRASSRQSIDAPRSRGIPLIGDVDGSGSILERSGTDYSIPPQFRGQRLGY